MRWGKRLLAVVALAGIAFGVFVITRLHGMSTEKLIQPATNDSFSRIVTSAYLKHARKIEPSEKSVEGEPLLFVAFWNFESAPRIPEADEEALEKAAILIAKGADLDATRPDGKTLLMVALDGQSERMLRFLVANGAKVDAHGAGQYAGETAISWAEKRTSRDLAIAGYILDCDPSAIERFNDGDADYFFMVRWIMDVTNTDPVRRCTKANPSDRERILSHIQTRDARLANILRHN